MRRILLLTCLMLTPWMALSQAVRYDFPLQTAGPNVGAGLPQALWLANATVQICQHPATSSCTPAVTYNDINEDAQCPSSAPLVQLPGTTCTANAGTKANIGFWYAGGNVDYIVTSTQGTFGPYTVTGSSAQGNFVSTTITSPQTTRSALTSAYHASTAPVTFAAGDYAALGWGNAGDEADIYTGASGGTTAPCFNVYGPNNLDNAWYLLATVDCSGDIGAYGNFQILTSSDGLQGPSSGQIINDDSSGGWNIKAASGSTYGVRFYEGTNETAEIDPSGNFLNPQGIVVPYTATGYTGTGNMVLSAGPTFTGVPKAPTVANCSGTTTQLATVGTVSNCITAISTGVISINGTGGAFTFAGNVTCTGTTCTFTATGIANTTLTLAGATYGGNSCSSPQTFTMTGVTTSNNIWAGFSGNPAAIVGWGSSGGLQLDLWASGANTGSYVVCNPTSASITQAGSITFNISAQ